MPKHIALIIGISEYRFLPKLAYAQKDAELIEHFLKEAAGFSPQQGGGICLCTNTSPEYKNYSTRPTRTELRRVLRRCFNQKFLSSEDSFCFFFSGHGVRYNNKDYLMPIDGDPEEPDETAIELNYVTERLTRSGAGHVVIILDACRSEGQKSSQTDFGQNMPEGVTTIFSCYPKEPSYEIGAPINQSAFTYVLLQCFRQQTAETALTIAQLETYLKDEVSQLNQRYGKPAQRPHIRCDFAANGNKILLPHLRIPLTLEQLKAQAFRSEALENWVQAQQLWMKVLHRTESYTPDHVEAELGLERVILKKQKGGITSGTNQFKPKLTPPHAFLSPPKVERKELIKCDPSKLLFLKNVRDPSDGWAYTLERIQQTGSLIENRVFELFWPLKSRGAKSASKGDLMLLNQHARVTHVVEMLDNEVRESEVGYFRWVRIVWLPKQADWDQLPHQRKVLGFEPPRIGGGTTYSFTSPNFGKFRAAWDSLEAFQIHIFQLLMESELCELDEDNGNELHSERGIDYSLLKVLLKNKEWKAADMETARRMLEVVGRSEDDWIRGEDFKNFPCVDLQTINYLWSTYSKGRFGFSAQRDIYVEFDTKLDSIHILNEIWEKFGDQVGWRVGDAWISYSDVKTHINAPNGHLPVCLYGFLFGSPAFVVGTSEVDLIGTFSALVSRLEECKL
ncbi:MAG: GUN4 domain-containing protein [Leptolyngbyaceae cyanobacterium]